MLAQEFVSVFEAAGWDHHGEAGVSTQEWPRDPVGIEVVLNEDDARADHIPPGVAGLINVVRQLGLVYDNTSTWTTMSRPVRPCSRSARNCGNELRPRPPAGAALILQYADAASRDLRPPAAARPPRAGGRAWAGDVPARPRGRRSRRAACPRCCAHSISRSISARRPMRCGARWRIGSARSSRSIRRGASAGERLAVVADEEALPFRDASLDLVVSALALAVRQRSAGHADPDPPRAQAGRAVPRRHDRRRQPRRVARSLRRGRGRSRGRRVAARRAVRRPARSRRAAAARGLRAAGHRRRPGHGALRLAARADARPSPHGRGQRADRAPPHAAAPRDACAGCWKSMPSASPMPTAASARPSRSSGCPAGRRTKASSSR